MTIDELMDLSDADQKKFLNGELESGKTPEDVYKDLDTDALTMAELGFFLVGGKFMIKPTRGFARTKPTNLG